jgi:hypothetical protein
MGSDKTRSTQEAYIEGNDGEAVWQRFVRKHENIFMVLCGHHFGEATVTSIGDHGNPVHQLLSDFQDFDDGGESWLRYMVFQSDANKVSIYTYNPALDQFRNKPCSRFDLDCPMA